LEKNKLDSLKLEILPTTVNFSDRYGIHMDRIDNSCGTYNGDSVQLISKLANLMKSNLVMDEEAIKMFINLYLDLSQRLEDEFKDGNN
jgi:hypothetical protein